MSSEQTRMSAYAMGSLDWLMSGSMLVVLILTPLWFIQAPPAVGVWWDSLMAVGLLSALMLSLMGVLSPRFWSLSGYEATTLLYLHRYLGMVLLLLSLAHAIGLLILEPITIEYLKLRAPGYMLAGIGALILLVALVWPSLRRMAWRMHYRLWRISHALMSVVTIGLVAWHILGSGYGFIQVWKWVVACIAFVFPTLWIYLVGKNRPEVVWPKYGHNGLKGRASMLQARRYAYRWMWLGVLVAITVGGLRQL